MKNTRRVIVMRVVIIFIVVIFIIGLVPMIFGM